MIFVLLIIFTANIINFASTEAFCKTVKILSVKNISITIKQNQPYIFPKTVIAMMNNKAIKSFTVVWEKKTLDTSKPGISTFIGNVKDYNRKVLLTVKVTDESKRVVKEQSIPVEPVTFNNKTIEDEVRMQTRRLTGELTINDIERVNYLNLSNKNLVDISDLSKLKKLINVDLSCNKIRDISVLGTLKNLKIIDISVNLVESVACLNQLPELIELKLSGNLIDDYQTLKDIYAGLKVKDFELEQANKIISDCDEVMSNVGNRDYKSELSIFSSPVDKYIVGKWLFYSNKKDKLKLYKIRIDGELKSKLTDDISIDNIGRTNFWIVKDRIIYTLIESNFIVIYSIDFNGLNKTKLASGNIGGVINTFSNKIIYSVYDKNEEVSRIFLMDYDGGNQKPIVDLKVSNIFSDIEFIKKRFILIKDTCGNLYKINDKLEANIVAQQIKAIEELDSNSDICFLVSYTNELSLFKISDNSITKIADNIPNISVNSQYDEWVYASTSHLDVTNLLKSHTQSKEDKVILTGIKNISDVRKIYKEYVYYINSEDDCLWRIRKDGSENELFIKTYYPSVFDIKDEWVYYLDWSNEIRICRIKLDGTEKTNISDAGAGKATISENKYIYYTSRGEEALYRCNLDGSSTIRLIGSNYKNLISSYEILESQGGNTYLTFQAGMDPTYLYKVGDDGTVSLLTDEKILSAFCGYNYIIYKTEKDLYSYNINTGLAAILSIKDINYKGICVNSDVFYYYNYIDRTIYRYDLKTNEGTKIINKETSEFSNVDNMLFYSSNGVVYRVDLNLNDETKLIEGDSVSLIGAYKEWVYFKDKSSFWRIKIDGTDKEKISDNEDITILRPEGNDLFYFSPSGPSETNYKIKLNGSEFQVIDRN